MRYRANARPGEATFIGTPGYTLYHDRDQEFELTQDGTVLLPNWAPDDWEADEIKRELGTGLNRDEPLVLSTFELMIEDHNCAEIQEVCIWGSRLGYSCRAGKSPWATMCIDAGSPLWHELLARGLVQLGACRTGYCKACERWETNDSPAGLAMQSYRREAITSHTELHDPGVGAWLNVEPEVEDMADFERMIGPGEKLVLTGDNKVLVPDWACPEHDGDRPVAIGLGRREEPLALDHFEFFAYDDLDPPGEPGIVAGRKTDNDTDMCIGLFISHGSPLWRALVARRVVKPAHTRWGR
jgi:hypothetical protein